jgi:hypothetical protein
MGNLGLRKKKKPWLLFVTIECKEREEEFELRPDFVGS